MDVRIMPVSEAKAHLTELVRDSRDTVLTRHGRPAAVIVSYERYEALLAQLGDSQAS